jgi:molybdopterin/thiamine biosynthesis adenylyltransferase
LTGPVTLVMTGDLCAELLRAAEEELETAGVLLAGLVTSGDGARRLLATDIRWCPPGSYAERHQDGLVVTSDGYVPALAEAEAIGSVALWLHTHPGDGASPRPSRRDKIVDDQLCNLFRLRTESGWYGSVVIAAWDGQPRFTGHLDSATGSAAIGRLWSVGDRFQLVHHEDHVPAEPDDAFDRNVRAFGGPVQAALGDLTVGIAGCGGTGSAVAEQLARLGVRRFILIDPDVLSASNVTRVYGSTPARVGARKVDVVGDLITSIAPGAQTVRDASMLTVQTAARRLAGADIVFGCTDDNAGRMVLSRLASYLLTPVIDCGVLLSSGPSGLLEGIDGRVTILAPGSACLICRDRVDQARAATELLTPEERIRRLDEGYAAALPGTEPAVVAFTTAVAAAAVTELIERLTGFGPAPVPSELILRLHDREVSTNRQEPRFGHYCDPAAGKLGTGHVEPFLEQMWSA